MPKPAPTAPPSDLTLVELAKPTVRVSNLKPPLRAALVELARLHWLLFAKPLVVTSGNDGAHSKGSKHFTDDAFDCRSWDKTPEEQLVWAVVLAFVARKHNLAVFDERARDAGPHWHIEVAD